MRLNGMGWDLLILKSSDSKGEVRWIWRWRWRWRWKGEGRKGKGGEGKGEEGEMNRFGAGGKQGDEEKRVGFES